MARRTNFTIKLKKKLPSAKVQIRQFREEVRKDIKKAGERGVAQYDRIVRNWSAETRPKFTFKVVVTVAGVVFNIRVKEARRGRPIWKWIDVTGVRAHKIRPKRRGGRLFFMWGGRGSYQSKTDHSPARFGGPGIVRDAKLTVAVEVNHPGFPPRKFSEAIKKELLPLFNRAIYNGGRRGLRRAKKGA